MEASDIHGLRDLEAEKNKLALEFSRSTLRCEARPDRDEPVITLLAELAERFPERGSDKLLQIMRDSHA